MFYTIYAMPVSTKKKRYLRWISFGLFFIFLLFLSLLIASEYFVVPAIKKRLHTLIIQGSDSLYNYQLGDLNASIFGGNLEVKNLQITVDSNRYYQLKKSNNLPSLTLQLNMIRGEIKGISVFALLFSKKIFIDKILTTNANIRLFRHGVQIKTVRDKKLPLWKAIQPAINSISINTINLKGVKLLYRNADTASAVKLQFDTCNAIFTHVLIDSLADADNSRIGFSKEVDLRFRDLKFRSPDSVSKMKAESITFSSKNRLLEIKNFKVQPTREEKKDFYQFVKGQEAMNVISFEKAILTNFRLDRFINENIIAGDSVAIQKPALAVYMDKTYPALFKNKTGGYPHQKLLSAETGIIIKSIAVKGASIKYSEKAAKTRQEGTLQLSNINMQISNVTNDAAAIQKNNKCIAVINGTILQSSPINTTFTFYLDSANGRFDAAGVITNVDAAQLNRLSVPFANVKFQSFNLHKLQFAINGNQDGSTGKVSLLYNNFFLTINKTDAETGVTTTNKFLTKIANKYTLQQSNPAPNSPERIATVNRRRVSSQGFFGHFWKTIFSGMQTVMLNGGQVE